MAKVRRPTLSDVAQVVGVSAKTVSRVLNGDGPAAPETKRRVLEAAAELGFQPNLMARNIRTGDPDSTIGLVIPDMANPFFGTVASGIEAVASERGLTVILGSSDDDPERERSLVATFLARRVSALLVVPSPGADHRPLRAQRSGGPPVVFLDRPGQGLAADCVVSANRTGARAGVAHLLAQGHRRVAFLGDLPGNLYTRRERLLGYRDALAEAGLPYDRDLIDNGHDQDATAAATNRLLTHRRPPTAVFAANNFAAMGAVLALARAGRRDIALVGFDDIPLAEVLQPALTVVAQDPVTIGRTAAERVFARLDGDRSRAHATEVPTQLIPRGSGELPPPAS
ncbi:MAG: LacI family DNA-binding transcriptional regulator [Streptomycetaceae bacterium]|nr:LacI family DNA-binding transcriptional regulator [Streptomycetaceae bacterium]